MFIENRLTAFASIFALENFIEKWRRLREANQIEHTQEAHNKILIEILSLSRLLLDSIYRTEAMSLFISLNHYISCCNINQDVFGCLSLCLSPKQKHMHKFRIELFPVRWC